MVDARLDLDLAFAARVFKLLVHPSVVSAVDLLVTGHLLANVGQIDFFGFGPDRLGLNGLLVVAAGDASEVVFAGAHVGSADHLVEFRDAACQALHGRLLARVVESTTVGFTEQFLGSIQLLAELYLADTAGVRRHIRVLVDNIEAALVQRVVLFWPRGVAVEFTGRARRLSLHWLPMVGMDLQASAVLLLNQMIDLTFEERLVAKSFAGPVINEEPLNGLLLIVQIFDGNLGTSRDVRPVVIVAGFRLKFLLLGRFGPHRLTKLLPEHHLLLHDGALGLLSLVLGVHALLKAIFLVGTLLLLQALVDFGEAATLRLGMVEGQVQTFDGLDANVGLLLHHILLTLHAEVLVLVPHGGCPLLGPD